MTPVGGPEGITHVDVPEFGQRRPEGRYGVVGGGDFVATLGVDPLPFFFGIIPHIF